MFVGSVFTDVKTIGMATSANRSSRLKLETELINACVPFATDVPLLANLKLSRGDFNRCVALDILGTVCFSCDLVGLHASGAVVRSCHSTPSSWG